MRATCGMLRCEAVSYLLSDAMRCAMLYLYDVNNGDDTFKTCKTCIHVYMMEYCRISSAQFLELLPFREPSPNMLLRDCGNKLQGEKSL